LSVSALNFWRWNHKAEIDPTIDDLGLRDEIEQAKSRFAKNEEYTAAIV